jgi:hypothetical protein
MGMYNEVFKKCPTCSDYIRLCISQIVNGFGGFYLDNPESIAEELDLDQIKRLKKCVDGEWFYCEKCDASFKVSDSKEERKEKMDILNSILGKNEQEN